MPPQTVIINPAIIAVAYFAVLLMTFVSPFFAFTDSQVIVRFIGYDLVLLSNNFYHNYTMKGEEKQEYL